MKDRIHPKLRAMIDNMTTEQKEAISQKLSEPSEVMYEEIQQRLKDMFNAPHPEATISGWVAVDDFDNAYIYHTKPTQRCREFCDTGDYITDWDCDTKYPNGKRFYVIDKNLFPNLTPDSDPLEVEITIKTKKQ